MNIAIIGIGPYGLCVLETLLRYLRDDTNQFYLGSDVIRIHIIDPNQPGSGVHEMDLPDYLLLNTACGQLDLFGSRYFSGAKPAPMLNFLAWLRRENYTIDHNGQIEISGSGREIVADDFLPRKLFGRYLNWVYKSLTSASISGVEILHYNTEALAIENYLGAEQIITANGEAIVADHVFLTTGHTANLRQKALDGFIEPYQTLENLLSIPTDSEVAVAGMGLVAIDVITALTTGRGGRFIPSAQHGQVDYQPSRLEPRIHLYSRNGLPFFCRPRTGLDVSGEYRAVVFSVDAVRKSSMEGLRPLDFRMDVQPLLFAEMSILFYCRHVQIADGGTLDGLKASLAQAWQEGTLEESLIPYRKRFGPFDPESLLYGHGVLNCATPEDYKKSFCGLLEKDIQESIKGENNSPLKMAIELLRVLRETIRFAVEFGGLTAASKDDFFYNVVPMINRVIVGPPIQRGIELLALIRAGIVDLPFGPAPNIRRELGSGEWHVSSTSLQRQTSKTVNSIIIGFIGTPTVDKSQSLLLTRLFEDGRIRPSKNSSRGAGIDVDRHGHPLNGQGIAEKSLSVLGPLTEGSRYFTYYAPSPKSRFRAFLDADAAVIALFMRYREHNARLAAIAT